MNAEQAMLASLEGTFTTYAGANYLGRVSRVSPALRPVENPIPPEPDIAAPHREAILTLRPRINADAGVSLDDIKTAVSAHYGVPVQEFISARRENRLVRCRMAYYWLARELTLASFPMIGRHCGMRDHTTVMHGVRSVKRYWPQFEHVIVKLKRQLKP